MSIYKVNSQLPTSDKIVLINDMILELEGRIGAAEFNKDVLDSVYSGALITKQFIRAQPIGSTSTGSNAWYNWTHLRAESGYSIWKFAPTQYRHNPANRLYFDDIELEYMGDADSESTTAFASVFTYDGSTYTDVTEEAGTEGGTPFDLMAATTHYLYVGDSSAFKGIAFNFQTLGANYTLIIEYYNGAWTTMTLGINDLIDNTEAFVMNGKITFTLPTDWTTTTVNGVSRYWIRISTSTTPVTTAKAYYIMPTASIPTLLKLSSTEITDEDWKWAHYGSAGSGNIYVTLRNAGAAAYEGEYYISSSSSSANKQNYFRFNHDFVLDYEDSFYTGAGTSAGFSNINVRVDNLFRIGQYERAFRRLIVKDQYGANYYHIYVSGGGLYAHPLLEEI